MKILVDADSCPVKVREIVVRAAHRRSVRALFVAAREIPLPASPWAELVQVEPGDDAADQEILRRAEGNDLVVTRDIVLAAELVSCGLNVINDRGGHFTKENIRSRLSERNFMAELRFSNLESIGGRTFSQKELHNFAATFDRELSAALSIKSEEKQGGEQSK